MSRAPRETQKHMGNPVVVMNVIDRTNERLAPTNRLVSHSEKPQSVTCACYLQHSRKMPVARGDFHSNTRRHSVELGAKLLSSSQMMNWGHTPSGVLYRSCCVVHSAVGERVTPMRITLRDLILITKNTNSG